MLYGIVSVSKHTDIGHFTEYGIIMPDGSLVYDITDSYSEIEAFVDRLNALQIDPFHIYDVIDDFLFEKYTKLIKYEK